MLTLLWLGSFGVFGQVAQDPDWKWQNPLPTNNRIYDVHFVNSFKGWAVGEYGTVVVSTNGGNNWYGQNSGTANTLRRLKFYDLNYGMIIGDNGTLLKTTNGGITWNKIFENSNFLISDITLISSEKAFIVGSNSLLKQTTNGGQTWQDFTLPGVDFNTVQFLDTNFGVISTYNKIFKTTNGGLNWTILENIFSQDYPVSKVFLLDSLIGYAAGGNGYIGKTTNGGQTWITQNSGFSFFSNVYFSNTETGWAMDYQSESYFKTTNGGVNWIRLYNPPGLSSVFFANSSLGWATSNDVIYKTTNGGVSWNDYGSGTRKNLYDVTFTSNFNGFAVGQDGLLMKTTNGGGVWSSQGLNYFYQLENIQFFNKNIGWIQGPDKIFKTTNGGSSWQSYSSPSISSQIRSIFVLDSLNVFYTGLFSKLGKTTNGGINWTTINLPNDPDKIFFVNLQVGWFTSGTSIYRTTDGGINWAVSNVNWPGSNGYSDIFFINQQIGWAVGGSEKIFKTTNGGVSWISQTPGGFDGLARVKFLTNLYGFVIGAKGTIMRTTNGGNTWVKLPKKSNSDYTSIFINDINNIWVVGFNGTIISTFLTNTLLDPNNSFSILGQTKIKKTSSCFDNFIPFPNQILRSDPGPFYALSNLEGEYNMKLPFRNIQTPYSIRALSNSNSLVQINVNCPPNNNYNLLFNSFPDTLSNKDFGFEITPCHHLEVQLASNRRRRCFQNTTSIFYQNQGSLSAPDSYVLVEFPKWVRPVSATRNYIALNDSVWRFNLDTVSAGESGSFIITDSVLCGNVGILGLSQCTKATIYPAPNCPTGNWNGASLSASGKCSGNGIVRVSLANTGTGDMLDSTSYRIYLDSILVFQKKVKLVQNDSLVLQVQANGKLVHVEADQVTNHPTQYSIVLNVEACGLPNQNISKGFVNKFPLAQSPNSKTHCLPIIGAYDPNDKMVVPQGFTNQNIIPPNTQLEYLVRFQNTGNDTAFTVFVIDTLDTNLNPESLELGAASHNYQLSMQTVKSGKTFLRWQFNNIQLPDSSTNKLKSNGFIQYRISPKANLSLGSKVRNHAEIYFDFNPPIITNQTLSTFGNVVYKDSTLNGNVQIINALPGKLSPKQIGVNLYPNPVTAHSLTADFQTKGNLTLFNAQGQLVFEKQNIEGKQVLPIQLRTGFYMAQLRTEKGVSVVKIVVEAP